MKVFIKHMVCPRCQLFVSDELDRLRIPHGEVKLGEVTLDEPVAPGLMELLKAALLKSGLEIIDDKKSLLVEKIKTAVIEQIHFANEPLLEKFSAFLERKLQYDYTYLSNLFAATEGETLEHYIIRNKIEKAKQLLIDESLSVAKVASRMNYCSAAHLSKQFKKVTGYTASHIKKLNRIQIENPSQSG
jgi:AraC-like DNA-binding protein